jgi:Cu(I)/Ag(I) efflux system membrane fusion protein
MKILDKIKSKVTYTNLVILIAGILIGWLIFGGNQKPSENLAADHTLEDHEAGQVWTCSMHPQIREDGPGKCPICGMDLVPVEMDETDLDEEVSQFTVKLSNAAIKIAEVSTTVIERKAPYNEIYLPGKVMPDERRISQLTSRFAGRIEKLSVNFTGQKVREGQVLAKIYSPELVTAQKELFEAVKYKESNPRYYEASRQKLNLWSLTEQQINNIEEAGEVEFYFDVLSPISGTITIRHVTLGDYVKEGSLLFEVMDLSHVWVVFDAYESDLPWIKLRDKINFTIKSIPGRKFDATITFIDPVINRQTRVAGVRAELNNPRDILKPQMLASGILITMLPGSSDDELVIPKSAILWTGKKAIVYVMTDINNNLFQYREIELGAEAGNYYVVTNGLSEGEKVATNGVFKIDAAAQLQGKQSMMNPEGGKSSTPHQHGEMKNDMEEEIKIPLRKETTGSAQGEKVIVDEKFKVQLTNFYKSQLQLQEALVATDAAKAKLGVPVAEAALSNVDMTLVKGEMHNLWMSFHSKFREALDRIENSNEIETQRLIYADFSESLYGAIKKFGIVDETVYYKFCPMARENKGAYWLSSVEEIRNPYFGDAMLTCGANTEVIRQ